MQQQLGGITREGAASCQTHHSSTTAEQEKMVDASAGVHIVEAPAGEPHHNTTPSAEERSTAESGQGPVPPLPTTCSSGQIQKTKKKNRKSKKNVENLAPKSGNISASCEVYEASSAVSSVPYFPRTPMPQPRTSPSTVWSINHNAQNRLTCTRPDTFAYGKVQLPPILQLPLPPAHWIRRSGSVKNFSTDDISKSPSSASQSPLFDAGPLDIAHFGGNLPGPVSFDRRVKYDDRPLGFQSNSIGSSSCVSSRESILEDLNTANNRESNKEDLDTANNWDFNMEDLDTANNRESNMEDLDTANNRESNMEDLDTANNRESIIEDQHTANNRESNMEDQHTSNGRESIMEDLDTANRRESIIEDLDTANNMESIIEDL